MNHTTRMHRLLRAVQAASSSSSHCMSSTSGSRPPPPPRGNFKMGKMLAPPAAVVMFGGAALMFSGRKSEDDNEKAGRATRIYSVTEFDKMVEKEGRIVVAYQGGLYDMSNFTGHPGGVGRLEGCTTNPLIFTYIAFDSSLQNYLRYFDTIKIQYRDTLDTIL